MKITMAHGSGGKSTSELISNIFAKNFDNPVLAQMEDSSVVPGAANIAMTTDSFVVTPVIFAGGDIGRLAVCGTVNDLLMSGSVPKYLTCGFILEEGCDTEELEKIVVSMAKTAQEANVTIVAGDTKVVEGKGGMFINTAGVGFLPEGRVVGAANCKAGDTVLVSGNLGDHHAAILSARMNITNTIQSDCAPLNEMVNALLKNGIKVKAMRDVTRGGLATVLNEFAAASQCGIELDEQKLPVSDQVRGFCGILGLDPLYMGNEGKMTVVVAEEDAKKAVDCMRNCKYGENAAIIGKITSEEPGKVLVKTAIGGTRIVTELYGEGLPRIC
ncbi:MAG TPA: hydrogenase expression/formation protein HypE [Oscillospiraceae bacterium]|nr:hydrogenase expression/formation protein HypE [Oscillospiraceae bacterium]